MHPPWTERSLFGAGVGASRNPPGPAARLDAGPGGAGAGTPTAGHFGHGPLSARCTRRHLGRSPVPSRRAPGSRGDTRGRKRTQAVSRPQRPAFPAAASKRAHASTGARERLTAPRPPLRALACGPGLPARLGSARGPRTAAPCPPQPAPGPSPAAASLRSPRSAAR